MQNATWPTTTAQAKPSPRLCCHPGYSSDAGGSVRACAAAETVRVWGTLRVPRRRHAVYGGEKLADLVRQGGARPLNLSRKRGEALRLALLDPAGVWSEGAPHIEVALEWAWSSSVFLRAANGERQPMGARQRNSWTGDRDTGWGYLRRPRHNRVRVNPVFLSWRSLADRLLADCLLARLGFCNHAIVGWWSQAFYHQAHYPRLPAVLR